MALGALFCPKNPVKVPRQGMKFTRQGVIAARQGVRMARQGMKILRQSDMAARQSVPPARQRGEIPRHAARRGQDAQPQRLLAWFPMKPAAKFRGFA
jgi:hypothetical protein